MHALFVAAPGRVSAISQLQLPILHTVCGNVGEWLQKVLWQRKTPTLSYKTPGVSAVESHLTAAEQTLCWLELEAAEKTRGEGQLLNFFQQLEKLETRCTQ